MKVRVERRVAATGSAAERFDEAFGAGEVEVGTGVGAGAKGSKEPWPGGSS